MRPGRGRERGFTYIWLMFAVALIGIALAGAGQLWRTEAQREKEKELMFVGEQFRRAIGLYYENSPGAKRYPPSLEKLLLDDRFPVVKRHLRKIFADPLTGKPEWGLVTQPGIGITAVYSLSTKKPLKRANFHERYASFEKAETYKDWKFAYSPGDPELAAPQPQTPPIPGTQPEREAQRQQRPQTVPPSQAVPPEPRMRPEPSLPFGNPSPADSDSDSEGFGSPFQKPQG